MMNYKKNIMKFDKNSKKLIINKNSSRKNLIQ